MNRPEVQPFFHEQSSTWTYVVHDGRAAAIVDPVLDFDGHSGRADTASAAAVMAFVRDAGLTMTRENPDRIGVMMGTALGGVAQAEAQAAVYMQHGLRHVTPTLATAVFGGAVSCNIAIHFGCTGPNSTNGMSCASGTIGVGDAFHAIRADRADVMLAGGAEAPLAPLSFGAFTLIRAMSTRNDDPATASRPFDAGRDGSSESGLLR